MTTKINQATLYRGDDEWTGPVTDICKALIQGYRPKPKKSAASPPDIQLSVTKKEVKLMSGVNVRETIVGFGREKQTNLTTANVATEIWRLDKADEDLANPILTT